VSGPGTYERGADICASLLGTQVVTQPEATAADKVWGMRRKSQLLVPPGVYAAHCPREPVQRHPAGSPKPVVCASVLRDVADVPDGD